MKKKLIICAICICAITMLFQQSANADSLERLSAIQSGTPWDCQVVGNYVFLANRNATAIIDISDSTNPILTYTTTGGNKNSIGLNIQDTLLFVNRAPDIWIGVIFPPDSIKFITLYDLVNPAYEPWGIEARDTILYVANGDRGLFILNVKDPYNPSQISYYDTPGILTEFFILDTLIYCADADSMIILNIANPASPQRIGAVDIPLTHRDLYVVWPYAYCTSHANPYIGFDGSIQIVDVSNPSDPLVIGSFDGISGNPRAVFVNDEYVYVAARDWWYPTKKWGEGRADIEGGVRIASGIIPDSLIISHDTPGDAVEIYVRGNLVLVPDSDSLMIYQHNKTGIAEGEPGDIPLTSKFSVYPNPFTDKVTCYLQFHRSTKVNVSVYDKAGRKVREIYHGPVMAGNTRFYWDRKNQNGIVVPAGTYFIAISDEQQPQKECRKVTFLGRTK